MRIENDFLSISSAWIHVFRPGRKVGAEEKLLHTSKSNGDFMPFKLFKLISKIASSKEIPIVDNKENFDNTKYKT